ncbi:hypothetical protein HG530_001729 [Fusarium avenaceum]|nr:hypothetical protein HG530_001729 [Fusarium avenaceum]
MSLMSLRITPIISPLINLLTLTLHIRRLLPLPLVEQHNGDEEPAQINNTVVDDGEKTGCSSGRMNCLCKGHDGCHSRAGDGAAEPLDGGEAAAEEKELGDADANDRSDELATEEVSRLGEGRFDGVELKNSTGTLSNRDEDTDKCPKHRDKGAEATRLVTSIAEDGLMNRSMSKVHVVGFENGIEKVEFDDEIGIESGARTVELFAPRAYTRFPAVFSEEMSMSLDVLAGRLHACITRGRDTDKAEERCD